MCAFILYPKTLVMDIFTSQSIYGRNLLCIHVHSPFIFHTFQYVENNK